MTRTNGRAGFTLIELLVGLSIIITLSGFVLLVFPGARDQDRVRNGVSDVGGVLKMAQGMAARDKGTRGVRFIVSLDTTNNPQKTDSRWVTELQYIEMPPPLIPNRTPLTTTNPAAEPRVRFFYTIAPTPANSGGTPAGTITRRQCFIENLTLDQANQVRAGCTIVMPVFGTWHKIIGITSGPGTPNAFGLYNLEVLLEVYPDANMGGSSHAQTHHFAIYLLATPLVGEPTVLLPKDICVDLNLSVGPPPGTTTDFDVLFGPDGKLVGSPSGQLFLWVRNYTKAAVYTTTPSFQFLTGPALVDAFRKGGEQHILSIRASGTHGHNQAAWPDATGTYTTGNPYSLVQQELNQ